MKAFEEVINETVCGERGGVDRLASKAVCEGGETAKRAISNLIERQKKLISALHQSNYDVLCLLQVVRLTNWSSCLSRVDSDSTQDCRLESCGSILPQSRVTTDMDE